MVSFDKSAIPAALVVCLNLLLLSEAKPYGEMLPSAPAMDSSPWMPIAQPKYMSYGSLDNSYGTPHGFPVVPLQTAFLSSDSSIVTSKNTIPTIPEAPGPSSSWLPPTPPMPETPAAGLWGQPNPTLLEASDAIPIGSQEETSAGSLAVVPYWMRTSSDSPMSAPPPIAEPSVDIPANEFPQSENPWALSQPPLPPPDVPQRENADTNVIVSPVQDSISPAAGGPSQDGWPQTPEVAANLPTLPPATFGQFAVQPAR